MGFIDSYKHLEKLCGEILNDDRRIFAYIDEMIKSPRGSIYVPGWNDDLNTLKHYRWIRNKITHEPGYSEENMCEPEDALWLDNFYSRIMNQTDPLALYLKAIKPHTIQKPKQIQTSAPTVYTHSRQTVNPMSQKSVSLLPLLIGILFGVCFLIIIVAKHII